MAAGLALTVGVATVAVARTSGAHAGGPETPAAGPHTWSTLTTPALGGAAPSAAARVAPWVRGDAVSAHTLAPSGLRVQGWDDPLDVGTRAPSFTWVVNDANRGERQTAYEIGLISDPGSPSGLVWDSGAVRSGQSAGVGYTGPALASDTTYSWAVRTWDARGGVSAWSPPARFAVGLVDPGDWQAWWLHGASGALVRTSFTVTQPVVQARLYAAAQGLYVPHLDGHAVGDGVLASSWTDWSQRTLVRSYDVTADLGSGPHVLGAELAEGQKAHYEQGPPLFAAQLVITYAGGQTQVVASDGSWRTSAGPTRFEDPLIGEVVDRRAEPVGWDTPGYDATGWPAANAVSPVSGRGSLAIGRPVRTSGAFSRYGWSPAQLVDNVATSTDWSLGLRTLVSPAADTPVWAQVDLGGDTDIDSIELDPATHVSGGTTGDGAGFPLRYKVEVSDDPDFATAVLFADRTAGDQPNPADHPVLLTGRAVGRYVRFTATRLVSTPNAGNDLRLAELRVFGPASPAAFTHGTLAADPMPPMRITARGGVRSLRKLGPSDFVLDLGQEYAGWVTMTAAAPAGTTVLLHYGEVLTRGGHVTTQALLRSETGQTDTYTFRGDPGGETFRPQFSYKGFRYIEVTGLPDLGNGSIQAEAVRSAVAVDGSFGTTDGTLQRIQRAVLQTQLNSLHGLPEDSPTREKRGWGLDAMVTANEALDNLDAGTLEAKWLDDIAEGQRPDGGLHPASPGHYVNVIDPAWGSAYPQVLWQLWLRTGDISLLARHIDGVRRWVDYEGTRTDRNHLLVRPEFRYGSDWLALESTPVAIIETVTYWSDLRVLTLALRTLGQKAAAASYDRLSRAVATSFNRLEWDPKHHWYGNGSQASQALPLAVGLVPGPRRAATADALVGSIRAHHDHVLSGMVGTQAVFRALTVAGRPDVALAVAGRHDYPSYGYMIGKGPGTIWESWSHGDGHDSRDHPALGGAVGEWFYQGLAGIQLTADGPGGTRLRLAPQIPGGLVGVNARMSTGLGIVTSGWRQSGGGHYTYTATVPVGATATVVLPRAGLVRESGHVVWSRGRAVGHVSGVTGAHRSGDGVTLTIGSGRYSFTVR